jgi:hypothetical protein
MLYIGTESWLWLVSKAHGVIPERNNDRDVMQSTRSKVYDAEQDVGHDEWATQRLMSPHELGSIIIRFGG